MGFRWEMVNYVERGEKGTIYVAQNNYLYKNWTITFYLTL